MIYLSDDGDAQLRDLMARCLRNLDDPSHERREEALRTLAKRAGVELEPESPVAARMRGEKEAIYNANAIAAITSASVTDNPTPRRG